MAKKILGVRLTSNNVVVASVAILLVIAGIFSQYYWRNLQTKATLITGKSYFIDKDNAGGKGCNDTWPGTIDQPLCTITAATVLVQPGDGILFRKGTYPPIKFTKSGTEGKYIVLASYNDEPVLVTGKSWDGILLKGTSYVQVYGFEVTGATGDYGAGITLMNDGSKYPMHNIIENNIVHDNVGVHTQGIAVFDGSYNKILRNKVYKNYYSGIIVASHVATSPNGVTGNEIIGNESFDNTLGAGNTDGIKLEGPGTKNTLVANNIVHGNSDDGIDTWNSSHNTLVGNIAYGQVGVGDGNGFKLGGTAVSGGHNIIKQNIAYGNRSDGFDSNDGFGNRYYNNVAYNNTGFGFDDGWRDISCPSSPCDTVYINNIGYNNGRGNLSAYTFASTSHNNLWFSDTGGSFVLYNNVKYSSLADFYKASGNRLDNPSNGLLSSLSTNPLFANVSGRDFSLQPSSPAIDHGDPANPGQIKISGSVADIGAVEYGIENSSTPTTVPIATAPPQATSAPVPTVAPSPVPTTTPDTTPPSVSISNPSDGSTISSKGNQNVSVSAQDPHSGIASIKIYFDNTLIKTCTNTTSCSGSVKMNNVSTGSHAVVAVAANRAGLTNSQAIVVNKK